MKTLELNKMEAIQGGSYFTREDLGCFYTGLAAGVGTGMNPLVGVLTFVGCLYLYPHKH